jgi:hypothetical protein
MAFVLWTGERGMRHDRIMSIGIRPSRVPTTNRARGELTLAWVAIVGMLAMLVALFLTETMSEIYGPLAVVTALLAVWLGIAARRHGEERGYLPAIIGGGVAGFFLAMVTLAFFGHLFGFE